ncbi:hypothetical protein V6N13_025927 [Hibiscus sabdariffa]
MRTMERLNGFSVYGFRLTVKLANPKKRNQFPNQVGLNRGKSAVISTPRQSKQEQVHSKEPGDSSSQAKVVLKKIVGHVEDEDLWRMKRCLVGVMANVCSVQSIILILQGWGLGDIKIQRMGGKTFLLMIEDDELYIMLEDLDWSYLKEILCKVEPWSESMSRPERATWLEVSGIPLHCWNDVTLRRVAELWGYFESLGENANHRLNCEKVTVLITTNQVNRIEEIVELNVGNMKYEINVVEIGFKDETCDPLLMKGNMNKIDHFGDSIMENQSESSPDTGKSSLPLDDKLNCSIEKDALEVMNIGSKPKGNVERRIESSSKSAQSKSSDKMNRNWSKVVAKPESNVGAKQGVHESGGG